MLFHQSHLNLKTDPYEGSFYTKINLFSTILKNQLKVIKNKAKKSGVSLIKMYKSLETNLCLIL